MLLAIVGCQDVSLEGKLCDSTGSCLDGFVCDPATNRCVRPGDVTDMQAWLANAYAFGPTELRLRFSEAMSTDALNMDNYCLEAHDGDPSACTPLANLSLTSVAVVDEKTFALHLSAALEDISYTIKVGAVHDLGGNAIGDPDYADFAGVENLRVIAAYSDSVKSIQVVFSKALQTGPDTANSADCSTAAECALRYRVTGPTDLGPITEALVSDQNRIRLTHADAQSGGTYMLTTANGIDGDGFDDLAWGAIFSADGLPLGASPADRAGFVGAGANPGDLSDGPVMVDPFSDGTGFSYIFGHRGRVTLGPSADGRGALRLWPDGSEPELMEFRFASDVNPVGTISSNQSDPPFHSIGAPGCTPNSPDCGPDNEDGSGLFSSGLSGSTEWLLIGGSKNNGHLDYIYLTSDSDRVLDLRYVDLSGSTGPATRSFSRLHVSDQRAYLGFPDSGGKRPYFVAILAWPSLADVGLDPLQNGDDGDPCDPVVHGACYLDANHMPYIGSNGDPRNNHWVLGIDFLADFNGRLYLGNNGGLVRATTSDPLDYSNHPDHWVATVPTAPEYALYDSIATTKSSDLEPADRAWPSMAIFHGRVYLARNVAWAAGEGGAQLWRCDPTIQDGPPPASASDCDPDDWSLIAPNTEGLPALSQFNDPDNTAISLLTVNGGYLYVGFDNPVDGIGLYRTNVADPLKVDDFEGLAACSAQEIDCPGLGGHGFGDPTENLRFIDDLSIDFEDHSYLYVLVSGPSGRLRVYRTRD
jgi:hypothetical protein